MPEIIETGCRPASGAVERRHRIVLPHIDHLCARLCVGTRRRVALAELHLIERWAASSINLNFMPTPIAAHLTS